MIVATVYLFAAVPKGFLPSEDQGRFNAQTEAIQGIGFDDMVRLQKKVGDVLSADPNVAAFTAAVHEVRVSLPAEVDPPFDIDLTMLARNDGLETEEADAIDRVEQAIRERLDPVKVHLGQVAVRTQDELSMRQYFGSRPLFLDGLTYQGDEVVGAEPFGRS